MAGEVDGFQGADALEVPGDAGERDDRLGRRGRPHMSASVCAMMAGPETLTPQGGNSLTVKKLSGRSDQKFSPSFRSW